MGKLFYCSSSLNLNAQSLGFNYGVSSGQIYSDNGRCADIPTGMTNEEAIELALRFCFSRDDCSGVDVERRGGVNVHKTNHLFLERHDPIPCMHFANAEMPNAPEQS